MTFIASDVCGNAAMTTAQFVIVDSAAPVITSVSRDTSIECHGLNPGPAIQLWLDAHGNAQAEDICGSIIWTHDLMDIPDQCELYEQVVLFTATDACGNSETTEAVISLSNTVGLEEQKIKNIAFDIFPNPAQEIIHIKFHSDDRQTRDLTLLDVMGRELLHHRGDESEVSLAVSEFAAGFYFLNIRTGDQTSAYMLLIR